jgi:putative addiction module component (TIGR02574 family)
MVETISIDAIKALTVPQRLALIEKIWETIDAEVPADEVPVSYEQRELLERRLEDLDRNPRDTLSLEEFREHMRTGR